MICEKHTERAGTLAVELPSLGVRRYMCHECRTALEATLAKSPRRAAIPGDFNDPRNWRDDYELRGDTLYYQGWPAENPRNEGNPTYSERGRK